VAVERHEKKPLLIDLLVSSTPAKFNLFRRNRSQTASLSLDQNYPRSLLITLNLRKQFSTDSSPIASDGIIPVSPQLFDKANQSEGTPSRRNIKSGQA
jgi:hypothetical protein